MANPIPEMRDQPTRLLVGQRDLAKVHDHQLRIHRFAVFPFS
jgi:hypothetical protein